ncbi:MAG: DUF5522 domain-containing protein [Sphingobacteriaceae bacterium]|nr:DUF5522 domain-containing protein [Sphingobacteriaceae bacterium]
MFGKPSPTSNQKLVEGEDFYFNEQGLMVFTALYHRKRGHCCKSGCRHCPYGNAPKTKRMV